MPNENMVVDDYKTAMKIYIHTFCEFQPLMPPLASCFRTNRKKGPYVRRTSKEKETNAELLFHCIF